jgi:hypothetical protein
LDFIPFVRELPKNSTSTQKQKQGGSVKAKAAPVTSHASAAPGAKAVDEPVLVKKAAELDLKK